MNQPTSTKVSNSFHNPLLKTTAWTKNGCPHCNSTDWLRLHRNWLQKVLHPYKNLCFCRSCRQQFWHDK